MGASVAYQEQTPVPSGKWPRDLNPWFQSCDLPDHLRVTILVMLTKNRYGIELWMSITRLAVELGVCRRTAQRRIRRLEELKVLKQIIKPNTYIRPDNFRPSATYQANPEAVKERPSWKDFEDKRATERRALVKSATQHRRCRTAPVASLGPAPSLVQPESPARIVRQQHRTAEQRDAKPRLSKTEALKFMAQMEGLKRGRTRHVEQVGGYGYELNPSDPRYQAPMKSREAFALVCKTWNRSEEWMLDQLIHWGYQMETEKENT